MDDGLTAGQHDALRSMFGLFDEHGAGHMHVADLHVALLMVGCDVPREAVQRLVATHCVDPDHGVTLPELRGIVAQCQHATDRGAVLDELFDMLDTNGAGELQPYHVVRWAADVARPTEDVAVDAASATGIAHSEAESMLATLGVQNRTAPLDRDRFRALFHDAPFL